MTRDGVLRIAPLLLAALGAGGACTNPPADDSDVPFRPDAEASDAEADGEPWGDECQVAYDCSNGVYCDGIEPCVRGWCREAEPIVCDDGLGCTVDACNEDLAGCAFTPDDALCDDYDPCTGVERCVPTAAGGCVPGSPRLCDDGQDCTDDYCLPETGDCAASLHDGDGDVHGDRRCTIVYPDGTREQGDDCNDDDAAVFPGAEELCDDEIDNDCDRAVDIHDTACIGTNDHCDEAELIDHPGTWDGATRTFVSDVPTTCGSGVDAVYLLRLSEDHDVSLLGYGDGDVSIAVRPACDTGTDLVCGTTQVRARGLAAGDYYVVVKTAVTGNFSLTVEFSSPTVTQYATGNDTCAGAWDMLADAGSTTVYIGSTAGMVNDATAGCAGTASSPDAVYRLVLAAAATVTLDMTTTTFDSALHVKSGSCPGGVEVGCNDDSGSTRRSYLSLSLAAGTYYVFADGYSSSASGGYELEARIAP